MHSFGYDTQISKVPVIAVVDKYVFRYAYKYFVYVDGESQEILLFKNVILFIKKRKENSIDSIRIYKLIKL